MYRKYQGTRTIAHCWGESKKLFAKFLALYLFEHALALIPMIWLKLAVDCRNAKLEEVFDLLNDERHSTFMVNLLVTLGVVVPIVTLLAQTGLAWLYMRYGHPWSRILKNMPKASNQPTETMMEMANLNNTEDAVTTTNEQPTTTEGMDAATNSADHDNSHDKEDSIIDHGHAACAEPPENDIISIKPHEVVNVTETKSQTE